MLNKLGAMLRRYEMVQPGDPVYCALSGGVGSVALLWALYLMKEKLGIELHAAHFNHRLRGAESDRDQAFAEELCDRFDIPLTVGSASVKPGEKGLEAAARDARYGFFETLPGKIATAHTADDNAETVLMHLVRGTGLKGLGGIAPVRGKYIRPMLEVTREEVLGFLEEYHLGFVEDSSNETDAFLRNRLRHHVMPLLKAENPRLSENLSVMAQRLRQDEQALAEVFDFREGLSVSALEGLAPARQSRVIGDFLRYCGVREPDGAHIDLVSRIARSHNPSAAADLPGGIRICRRYDRLVMAEQAILTETPIAVPGITEACGYRVIAEEAEAGVSTKEEFFLRVQGTPVLRPRREGDRIRLPGGSKTLKKLFIDRKIPADCRPNVPVLTDDEGVLAVYGIGADAERMVKSGRCVRIRFEKKDN